MSIMKTVTNVGFNAAAGKGASLVDENGKAHLDWFNDNGVTPLGYNDPYLTQAMTHFMLSGAPHRQPQVYGSHTANGYARALCDATAMDGVFFSNSGAESVEAAIKMARLYWHKQGQPRHGIVSLPNQFHGRAGFTMAASDSAPYHREGFGPMPEGFLLWQPDAGNTEPRGPFQRHYDNGRQPLAEEDIDWPSVAAIVLAPVLGNNVVEPYPEWLWNRINAIRERYGCLVIFDEVQTGMGRCGYISAQEAPEVGTRPDIITFGKGMAGGWPIAATLARGQVADAFFPGSHFSTFGGSSNAIIHVAHAYLAWVTSHAPQVRENMKQFAIRLGQMDGVDTATSFGGMVQFVPDYDGYDAIQLMERCRANGLLIVTFRKSGPIKVYLPLNSRSTDVQRGLRTLQAALAELKAG